MNICSFPPLLPFSYKKKTKKGLKVRKCTKKNKISTLRRFFFVDARWGASAPKKVPRGLILVIFNYFV